MKKVVLAYFGLYSALSERYIGSFGDIKVAFRRGLSLPVSIEEVELTAESSRYSEIMMADCKAIALCNRLRLLKIWNVRAIAGLHFIGLSCRNLESLSLECSGTQEVMDELVVFSQLKSLVFRVIPPRLHYISEIPTKLLEQFTTWTNLVELTGDFLNAKMGEIVASMPKLSSYTELCFCNDQILKDLANKCRGRAIANSLRTLRILDEKYKGSHEGSSSSSNIINDNDSEPALLVLFRTFQNLQHLALRNSRATLSGLETVQALSHLKKLETLDLRDNHMFFGGVTYLVDEWLRTCLPFFPKGLRVLDFSSWKPLEGSDVSAAVLSKLGNRIEEEIRRVIKGIERVDCTPKI
jgi:hypothetical protein